MVARTFIGVRRDLRCTVLGSSPRLARSSASHIFPPTGRASIAQATDGKSHRPSGYPLASSLRSWTFALRIRPACQRLISGTRLISTPITSDVGSGFSGVHHAACPPGIAKGCGVRVPGDRPPGERRRTPRGPWGLRRRVSGFRRAGRPACRRRRCVPLGHGPPAWRRQAGAGR